MSIWEFNAAVAGWTRAHVPRDPGELDSDQEAALSALLDKVSEHDN